VIPYPSFDPIALSLGPMDLPLVGMVHLRIHWYGLMYLVGFVAAWGLARWRASRPQSSWQARDVDDLIFYAALGVIIGGRLGWCLVYGLDQVVADPKVIFRIWDGGMSFHGGLVGVLTAVALFARARGRQIGDVFDFTAPLPGVGILAGRIGNFINGELWGKPTDAPWGFLVNGEGVHASQLYEGALEGLVLFVVLWVFTMKPRPRLAAAGLFLMLYGFFRFMIEFVRVPDQNMGYIAWDWLTTGQLLSLPMIVAGAAMLVWAYRRNAPSGNYGSYPLPRKGGRTG
jgi:phosphatidylglycerol:prolipoprotein diacylglycerol transferase